ncbi:MAG: S8 family serine peptidase, partial [Candidatus Hodarchaeota archaeon]
MISTESIHFSEPFDEKLLPQTPIPPIPSQTLRRVPDQWIIPSHIVPELIREKIPIEVKKELPALDLTIIKLQNGKFDLGEYPQASPNYIIRDNTLLSTKGISADKYSLGKTLNWVGAEKLQEEEGLTGEGVTVAILDSGINQHELVNTPVYSKSFIEGDDSPNDGLGHGTSVASIVSRVAPAVTL